MEKIPTVKEFLGSLYRKKDQTMFDAIEQAMVEFAKLHVEAALKEASEKAKCCDDAIVDLDHTIIEAFVEKNSILNSYSLDNIK